MTNEQREIHRKKTIIEYAERTGNIHKAYTSSATCGNHAPRGAKNGAIGVRSAV